MKFLAALLLVLAAARRDRADSRRADDRGQEGPARDDVKVPMREDDQYLSAEQRSMNGKPFDTFRRAQFAKFRKTKDYAYARGEIRENDDSKADEFLFEFAAEAYLSMIFPQ